MLQRRIIPFSSLGHPLCNAPKVSSIVVQIGRDEELSRLRAMVISSAGYSVQSIAPEEALGELHHGRGSKVWVFCHTLEFYEVALLAAAIRRHRPADKLLRLTGLQDIHQAPGLFDERLEPVNRIDDLLRVVAALARQ